MSAAIVNILGEEGFNGESKYEGLQDVLALENVFVHIYGKKETKPGRKMGHVTILGDERLQLVNTVHKIKQNLKVTRV
jgi:5-(carboxyamino)imidazole ribonucleotide synthase